MMPYYRNETLFSEIYLEEITRQPEQEEVLASLRVLREYREYADTSSLGAWTQSYLHEVLAALGFNTKAERVDLTQLFPIGSGDQPVSLCLVTLPNESLDNISLGRNWAEKIIRAIRDHGMQWGLLTNGKLWRIYHLDESTPYETYLEIDLEGILQDQAKYAYQIFYKFMKSENFVEDTDGKCQFDRFKKDSKDKIDYIEKELANALKQREENGKGVLSDLCMGYVDELRQVGSYDLDDEILRRKIYHGAMLYMFRLLFLFYADARGLMSDENHSLLEGVEIDARAQHNGDQDDATYYSIWEGLAAIFVDIDQTYNGGLFSPQESEFTQFIEETRIADRFLAETLFNLTTYHEKNGEERPISYRDMSVRHLGTLYEGLLEHKLFITKETTEVRVTKGKIEFIPASQGGKLVQGRFIPEGAVYFGSDPSERKSTGSYYTPEYIVDYIVHNTVGEKVKELKESFLKQEKGNLSAYSSAVDDEERIALASLLEENALTFIQEKVLTLSVLDPAMGSGHFLVNVANLISNFITDFLNELGFEGKTITATAYWRRWVVENCIYGVDLNPLAVELAKLSLWILSMAKDQPLSFTNHHLKCGNSLVGARLEEIGNYPFSTSEKELLQLNMFEKDANFRTAVEDAIAKSRLIASRASITLDDVEEKKSWLVEIEKDLEGYKAISHVHTALYFDSSINEEDYLKLVGNRNFSLAAEISTSNRYFHWELEFPEVFFQDKGFSCIVCNPPYDTFRENSYFAHNEAAGTGNLFSHFIIKAIYLNNDGGNLGFVIPLSLACGESYESIRRLIYKEYDDLYASHYSIRPAKLFPGVDQRITIFYTTHKASKGKCRVHSSRFWRWNLGEEQKVVHNPGLGLVGYQQTGLIPKVAGDMGAAIYKKVLSAPITLQSLMDGGEYVAYYHAIARYWIKTYDFIPYFSRDGESRPSQSSTLGTLGFTTEFNKYLFLLLTNSSLFYYWWIARGDEFHVLTSDFHEFGIVNYELFSRKSKDVFQLVNRLMQDYKKNSKRSTGNAGGKKYSYDVFFPRKSLSIIADIDNLIADIYGFDNDSATFLKTYDQKFRTDE
jgi:type I restriction-modification system DNA methylase subunit